MKNDSLFAFDAVHIVAGLELLRLGLRRYEEKKNPRCTTTYVEREILDNNGNIRVLRSVTRTIREN